MSKHRLIPFVIDFDQTLIFKDSLIESIKSIRLKIFLNAFKIYLLGGSLELKKFIFNNGLMKYDLKINKKIFSILKKSNRNIIVSAAYQPYLNIFFRMSLSKNRIIGSSILNLKSKSKANYLISRYGFKGFNYIGDSFSDIPVWRSSFQPYTVRRLFIYKFFVPNIKHADEIK